MNFWLHVLNMVLIFAVLGFSLNLLLGYGEVISIAIAAYFGIGAYTMAIATGQFGLHWSAGLVAAIVMTSLASAISAWPALRMRGEYLMLLTIAIQMVLYRTYGAARGITGGTSGISDIPRISAFGEPLRTAAQFLPISFGSLVIALALSLLIGRSPFGRVMRAMRDDEVSIQALGKNLVGVKFKMFALAGGVAGFAGALYAPYNAFVSPTTFSLDMSILIVALVVLGGAGNFYGTVLGAAILWTLPEALRFLDIGAQSAAPMRNFIYGMVLVLFMLFRPEGLLPEGMRLGVGWQRPGKPSATDRVEDQQPDTVVPEHLPSGDGAELSPTEVDLAKRPVTLTARGLNKSFGGIRAVDDVSLELRAGVVTALVGPNGAGKTSVFNALTGFVTPDSGDIDRDGSDLGKVAPWQRIHHGVARTFQDVRLFPRLSVLDNVAVAVPDQPGETLRGIFLQPQKDRSARQETHERAMACLKQVGMADRADKLLSSLSFGEQKLVSLARLIATDAEVVLLDEPASGVDREWVAEIVRIVQDMAASGRTVCLVEHNLNVVAQLSHYVYFMASGKIVKSGAPKDIITDPELGKVYFGTPQ